MDLLIVESPSKAKKIATFLKGFEVVATVGHIRELPQKDIGVEPPNFIPDYQVIAGKSHVVGRLRKAAEKAETIYIGTDLDREGEAIAWHVCQILGKKLTRKSKRVRYSEISKAAITNAIEKADQVNLDLVRAQEARRVIDRLVGYMVSPTLYQALKRKGVSAGRVQSVALKLLCLRDREIGKFKSKKHFGVRAFLSVSDQAFHADWVFKKHLGSNETLMLDKGLAERVVERTRDLIAHERDIKPVNAPAPTPLITSELLKKASELYGLSAKQCMSAAQSLFEAGLITYHRTDSPEIAPEFVETIRAQAKLLNMAVPEKAPTYKSKEGAQEAHECIRVTSMDQRQPSFQEGSDEFKVYQYIWFRTLASQLCPGMDESIKQSFINEQSPDKDLFIASSRQIKSLGWRDAAKLIPTKVMPERKKDEGGTSQTLPSVEPGSKLPAQEAKLMVKETKPPKQYTESTLITKLEEAGVGRPSTYASIIETLLSRGYVKRAKKNLVPTDLGHLIFDLLNDQFAFMSTDYTADIEDDIDCIAEGDAQYADIVSETYQQLVKETTRFAERDVTDIISKHNYTPATKEAPNRAPSPDGEAGDKCPTCKKGSLLKRFIKNGKNEGKPFLGCTSYPQCNYFKWLQEWR